MIWCARYCEITSELTQKDIGYLVACLCALTTRIKLDEILFVTDWSTTL